MKHLSLIFALLVTAAFVLSGDRGYAIVIDEVVVDVPFSFTVDNTTLPAGHYVISTPDSMVPNLLPLLTLGGWLGSTWGSVDSDVGGIAMLALMASARVPLSIT